MFRLTTMQFVCIEIVGKAENKSNHLISVLFATFFILQPVFVRYIHFIWNNILLQYTISFIIIIYIYRVTKKSNHVPHIFFHFLPIHFRNDKYLLFRVAIWYLMTIFPLSIPPHLKTTTSPSNIKNFFNMITTRWCFSFIIFLVLFIIAFLRSLY